MKKITSLSIIGFVICTAFIKPTKLAADYRDAYIGTYFCKGKTTIMSFSANTASHTINDTLTIMVSKDMIDSVLVFKIGRIINKFKLSNNILQAYPEGGHNWGKFISTDSVSINLAMGHVGTASYTGKKR